MTTTFSDRDLEDVYTSSEAGLALKRAIDDSNSIHEGVQGPASTILKDALSHIARDAGLTQAEILFALFRLRADFKKDTIQECRKGFVNLKRGLLVLVAVCGLVGWGSWHLTKKAFYTPPFVEYGVLKDGKAVEPLTGSTRVAVQALDAAGTEISGAGITAYKIVESEDGVVARVEVLPNGVKFLVIEAPTGRNYNPVENTGAPELPEKVDLAEIIKQALAAK